MISNLCKNESHPLELNSRLHYSLLNPTCYWNTKEMDKRLHPRIRNVCTASLRVNVKGYDIKPIVIVVTTLAVFASASQLKTVWRFLRDSPPIRYNRGPRVSSPSDSTWWDTHYHDQNKQPLPSWQTNGSIGSRLPHTLSHDTAISNVSGLEYVRYRNHSKQSHANWTQIELESRILLQTLQSPTFTEQPEEKQRPHTLSYSLWAKNVSCLASLASSPKNFQSMNRTSLLCCLKSVRDAIPLGLTQQDRSTLEKVQFSRSFIKSLPERDLPRFGRCAVVASASTLRKHQYGKEIDSHDAVFRFNEAPTVGYERFVGRRTTVRVINSQLPYRYKPSKPTLFSNLLSHPENNTIIFERDEIPAVAVGESNRITRQKNASILWNHSNWKPINKYFKLRQKFPNVSYYLIHPVFGFFSMKRLVQISTGIKSLHEASSGFVGVLLATLLCDSVTSYEVANNDPQSAYAPYYYSRESFDYLKNWHPLTHERVLIRKMGKCRRRTTICRINIADTVC